MKSKTTYFNKVSFILSNTSHPGNIGSAARAIKTMGFKNLTLINPKDFPSSEAEALASGADDILQHAKIFKNIDKAIESAHLVIGLTARKRELSQPHFNSVMLAKKIKQAVEQGQKISILFGNETSGLSNDELKHCQWLGYIDANKNYSSLNLSQAVQIMAYEIRNQFGFKEFEVSNKINNYVSMKIQNGFYMHLEEVLDKLEFFKRNQRERLMIRLRLMFNRIKMDKEEVNIMRGILKQIQKKIKSKNEK
jgi:TrmH family RNA methyltransferase